MSFTITFSSYFSNPSFTLFILLIVVIIVLMGYQSGDLSPKSASAAPSIRDPNLKVQVVAKGLSFPTTMDFLGPNDILVLEKNNGTVQRIQNGTMLLDPVLDVNVANKYERGMLGIAVLSKEEQQQENGTTYIFLYYTEADVEGSDICPTSRLCESDLKQLSNRLYRYEFVNNKLVNPKLLMELPASPIPAHNGGKILIGPDKNVYFTIGDLNYRTITQNFPKSLASNGTSAIYRVTSDGRSGTTCS